MKKKFILLLSALCIGAFAIGCSESNKGNGGSSAEQPALEFAQNKIEMLLGETKQLSLLALEEGETVVYSSNDESVLTVSQTGVVEGKGVGYAVVKATSSLGRTAFAQVNVHDPLSYPVPYLSLKYSTLTLSVGQRFQVEYTQTWLGEEVDGTVSMTSDNTAVVTVENGVLCAVGEGSAKVLVRGSSIYGETETKAISVTVLKKGAEFTLSITSKVVTVGKPLPLELYINDNGEAKLIENATFSVQNEEIAKVENGKLIALQGGNTTLQISVEYGGVTHTLSYAFRAYNPHTVTVKLLDGTVDNVFEAVYGDELSLELLNKNDVPEYTKEVKCWYANGEKLDGNVLLMPDEEVEISACFVNETEEDFSAQFINGHLLNDTQGANVEYVTSAPVGMDGQGASKDGCIKLTAHNWASMLYRFDKEMTVNEYSTITLRLYCPSSTPLLYFGVPSETFKAGNKKYEASDGVAGTRDVPLAIIETDKWVTLEMPLTAFVKAGDTLNGLDISAAGYFYIDYISVNYGLSEKDVAYQDKIFHQKITAAQNGSAEQESLLVEYYFWTKTLTAEEINTELHKSYAEKIRAIIAENFPNGLKMTITERPEQTGGSHDGIPEERFQKKDYKTDSYKDSYLMQFSTDVLARTVSLGKLAFNDYAQVTFGMFAACNYGDVKFAINGRGFTVPAQGYCRFVVQNGVLNVYNDCKGQESTLLLTTELSEGVLNGGQRLNVAIILGDWPKGTLPTGENPWAGIQVTEYHAYVLANDIQ